ncbi:hypothetical protein [Azospirillum sp.]|uniref:hypothetical protein n=1 Tax=Azospirillum sp. TaxID=34012 RepID=UPI003D749178
MVELLKVAVVLVAMMLAMLIIMLYWELSKSEPYALSFLAGFAVLLVAEQAPSRLIDAARKLANVVFIVSIILSVEAVAVYFLSSFSYKLITANVWREVQLAKELYENYVKAAGESWVLVLLMGCVGVVLARPIIYRFAHRTLDIIEGFALVVFSMSFFTILSPFGILAVYEATNEEALRRWHASLRFELEQARMILIDETVIKLLHNETLVSDPDFQDIMKYGIKYAGSCGGNRFQYTVHGSWGRSSEPCHPLFDAYSTVILNVRSDTDDRDSGPHDNDDDDRGEGSREVLVKPPPEEEDVKPPKDIAGRLADKEARWNHAEMLKARRQALEETIAGMLGKAVDVLPAGEIGKAVIGEFAKALLTPYIRKGANIIVSENASNITSSYLQRYIGRRVDYVKRNISFINNKNVMDAVAHSKIADPLGSFERRLQHGERGYPFSPSGRGPQGSSGTLGAEFPRTALPPRPR